MLYNQLMAILGSRERSLVTNQVNRCVPERILGESRNQTGRLYSDTTTWCIRFFPPRLKQQEERPSQDDFFYHANLPSRLTDTYHYPRKTLLIHYQQYCMHLVPRASHENRKTQAHKNKYSNGLLLCFYFRGAHLKSPKPSAPLRRRTLHAANIEKYNAA